MLASTVTLMCTCTYRCMLRTPNRVRVLIVSPRKYILEHTVAEKHRDTIERFHGPRRMDEWLFNHFLNGTKILSRAQLKPRLSKLITQAQKEISISIMRILKQKICFMYITHFVQYLNKSVLCVNILTVCKF